MEDNVKKEINDIKKMINSWRIFYSSQIEKNTDNSSIIEDFSEQIDTYALPYFRRLLETEYINQEEYQELLEYVKQILLDFYEEINNTDDSTEEDIDIRYLCSQFKVHKDLIDMHEMFSETKYSKFVEEQRIKAYNIAIKIIDYIQKKAR